MKRALLAGLAVVAIAAALPTTASATDTTTPTVPTECTYVRPSGGPAREAHQQGAHKVQTVSPVDCSEVAGICVYESSQGPSRTVHGPFTRLPDPCVPLDPSCSINASQFIGPQRVVHQPETVQNPVVSWTVSISEACQEAMVLALTPTGSDTAPTIWIATAFLGAGAVLIVAPRRLARR